MDNETYGCRICRKPTIHQSISPNVDFCRKCKVLTFDKAWDKDWQYFIGKMYDISD